MEDKGGAAAMAKAAAAAAAKLLNRLSQLPSQAVCNSFIFLYISHLYNIIILLLNFYILF